MHNAEPGVLREGLGAVGHERGRVAVMADSRIILGETFISSHVNLF